MPRRTTRPNADVDRAADQAAEVSDAAQRIRRSKAYQRFEAYLDALAVDALDAGYELLESYRAFGSRRASDYAREVIAQLKRDRGLG